jgi:hypothetical protein
MHGTFLIWIVLIAHFATSPFYYARWGSVGLIPDVIGFVLTAFIARLLIRSEVKSELDN